MRTMRRYGPGIRKRNLKKDKFFNLKTIVVIECIAFIYAAVILAVIPSPSEQKLAKYANNQITLALR